jgi:hypothetical protein
VELSDSTDNDFQQFVLQELNDYADALEQEGL